MRFCFSVLMLTGLGSSVCNAEIVEIHGQTMGTTYSVKWVADSDHLIKPEELQSKVDDRLGQINSMMSTYDPESELSRFNLSAGTDWFAVSPETALVAQRALEIAHESNGAFDPTVGRLVGLWSFGADHRAYEPPPQTTIDEALKSVGDQFIEVRLDPPALKKSQPDVQLDFSAIAKGYGVDALTELLQAEHVTSCLVEIGGEVRALETKAGQPWKLGIERPAELQHDLSATVELHDQALATSGDYRNYFEKDGVRYSHTINPQTGFPVTHQLASTSVIAPDCMTADALATTLMVLGPERGLEFANQQNVPAYLLVHDGEGYRELFSQAGHSLFHSLQQPEVKAEGLNLFSTFLVTALFFGIAIIGLAVGVIFSNRRLQGSCGGMSALKDEQGKSICEMCTTPPEECDRLREKIVQSCPDDKSE